MDSRNLAALLSSLISQLLLLFVIIPSSNLLSNTDSNSSPDSILPHLIHFLSVTDIAAILSQSKKRKRAYYPDELQSDVPRTPDSFKLYFKMSSSTFEWLSTLLEPLLDCRDPVNSPLNLPVETRLGVGLFRLATGSDYSEISLRFNVPQPAAKFCVKQLCRVLCTNFRFWVGFPCQNELQSVSNSIQTLTGLPNCCGVIDCTRFKIVEPNSREENCYMAAQIAVDSSSRILNIVAGYNGNKSNSCILKSSSLYKDIEGKCLLNSQPVDVNGVSVPQYVVGDVGYPLLPWLLVPFVNPINDLSKENLNSAIRLMRVPVLRTIASLKNWGVLSRGINAEFKTAVAYVGACSILHNALLLREDYTSLCNELSDYSCYDERSHYRMDTSLEEDVSEIRSALSIVARNSTNAQ